MDKIQLSRSYLKRPNYAIYSLLILVFLYEVTNWVLFPEGKLDLLDRYGGVLGYLYVIFRGGILPELVTLTIVITLIDIEHKLLKIKEIELTKGALLRYELSFLPVMLLAFLVFNPITQSVRYLLVEFPRYELTVFWENFIVGTYTWKYYFKYLFPVLVMGYFALNSSLLLDLVKAHRNPVIVP
jgi:two-component system LytT family response regulator